MGRALERNFGSLQTGSPRVAAEAGAAPADCRRERYLRVFSVVLESSLCLAAWSAEDVTDTAG